MFYNNILLCLITTLLYVIKQHFIKFYNNIVICSCYPRQCTLFPHCGDERRERHVSDCIETVSRNI